LTTAILVAGVTTTIGVELDALLATTAILEDNETWLNGLLLTWAAVVRGSPILELVEGL
jgi:hypothetical protein